MESSLKKLEENNYEVTVEVGREELAEYVKQAEAQISKDAQIDGFRKGKAPKDLIRQKVGEQYILETALDLAVHDSLEKTIAKDKLEVLKISNLDIKENSASKLVYKANLALFPKIKIGDLSGLVVKSKGVAVEPKEIDEAIGFLRNSRSKFIAKDGSAEKGDRVEIDFEVTSGGLPIEGGVSKNHSLVIGDNKFIPGFEDEIIGMEKNGEKKFSLVAPKDYFHKAIAGKKVDFAIKVNNIQKVEKPVIDDDFAKTLGKFGNLEELKKNISEGILEEKKMKEQNKLRLELLSKIVERSDIECPPDMVKEQLDNMVFSFDNELHQKGMELSMYLTHLNKTEDDLRKEWLSEAQKQVKFHLALKKIAKENNIQPSSEEVEEQATQLIQAMALRGQTDNSNLDPNTLRSSIVNQLTTEKTFVFLSDKYIK